MPKPAILLVEDVPEVRDVLSAELHAGGARVFPAKNEEDGLTQFKRRASEISAVLTDLRLDERDTKNRGGEALATKIAELSPNIPVFGVTAYAVNRPSKVFRQIYEKKMKNSTSPRNIYRNIDNIVATASEFDERRFCDLPQFLIDIKRKYLISESDFAALVAGQRIGDLRQVAFLAWHDALEAPPYQVSQTRDESASAGGEDLRQIVIVPAGTVVDDGVTQSDIAVVVRSGESSSTIAELFGAPLIFAYDESVDKAISQLLMHLYDCFKSFSSGTVDEFQPEANFSDLLRFRAFLEKSFR